MQREWWKNPLKHGVIDIAGFNTTSSSVQGPDQEIWRKQTGLVLMGERINILPGIRRMDALLNLCPDPACGEPVLVLRSEEHTSELQSLMRISYAVICLKKKLKIQAISLIWLS